MAKNENSEAAAPSRVGVWFQHHVHSVVFSLGRACRKPWATLLTVMVMALALALPLGLSIALDNLKQFAGSVQQSRDINVFLKGDVDGPGALRLAGQLRDRDDVAEVNVRTPEQGLQELRDAGLGEAIDALNDNPLPSLLVITPGQGKDDAQVKQFLVDRYGEFVLYKPDVAPGTYILWFGPLLLLLAGSVWVGRIVAKRARQPAPATDDTDQEW